MHAFSGWTKAKSKKQILFYKASCFAIEALLLLVAVNAPKQKNQTPSVLCPTNKSRRRAEKTRNNWWEEKKRNSWWETRELFSAGCIELVKSLTWVERGKIYFPKQSAQTFRKSPAEKTRRLNAHWQIQMYIVCIKRYKWRLTIINYIY